MDLNTTLAGMSFNKIDSPTFMDKNGKPGIAVGGLFATLEEIQYECETNDIYIHSLEETKSATGQTSYWMVYACREKSIPKNAMAILKRINNERNVLGLLPLANHSELGVEKPTAPTPLWP